MEQRARAGGTFEIALARAARGSRPHPCQPGGRSVALSRHRRRPPLFREGLGAVLAGADMDVVGQAATGEEALEVVQRADPDVVLMDLHMPGMGGVGRLGACWSSDRIAVLVSR